MDTKKKRALLVEINNTQKIDETMRRAFTMGKTLVPMLYPKDSEKAFQALELYAETLDKHLPELMDSIIDTRMGLYTDEEVQAMWDFFLGPMGQVLGEKGVEDREKSEALVRKWSERMMQTFQEELEKLEKASAGVH